MALWLMVLDPKPKECQLNSHTGSLGKFMYPTLSRSIRLQWNANTVVPVKCKRPVQESQYNCTLNYRR